MARRRLTDRTLKALKPAKPKQPNQKRPHDEFMDDLVQGFGVRVNDKGRKTFILIARYPGSRHPTRRALGQYEKGMSLESARKKAGEWRRLLADGVDPKVDIERKRKEEARSRADSFATVAETYIEHIKRAGYRSARDVELCLEREFTSRWGKRPIREIERRDVIEVLDAIVKRDAPYAAHNALAHLRSMFNWACERHDLETSPCDRIKPSRIIGSKEFRQRVLSDDELRAFWRATGRMGYPFGNLLRMLLLTGQRRDECAGARWREFDLSRKLWTVPPERFKSESTHLVPLSDPVIELLEKLPKKFDHLFSTTLGKKPVSGFSKAKASLNKRMLRTLKAAAHDRKVALPPFVIHDLRRTVRTRLASLKVPDTVAEMVIGHGRKGLQRVYDQHLYEREMRNALKLWSNRLRDIVDPPPANVVKLKAKA
jgi:integrase